MTELAWHAPRSILEICELIATQALPGWPEGVALPAEILHSAAGGAIAVEDAEGTPVVVLQPEGESWRVSQQRAFAHGPLRSWRRTPADLSSADNFVAVALTRGLSAAEVRQAEELASGRTLMWFPVIGEGQRVDLPQAALVRATAALGEVVPLAIPASLTAADPAALGTVLASYGAQETLIFDSAASVELAEPFALELQRSVPRPADRGVTLFFTGLSGSGKSTVAKALADRLEVDGRRRISMLDGDEVRRLLSAGLSFSRADRDLNIRRIGYVATEVTRHGGIAICAPIAPFAQVRDQVGDDIAEVGDFVLIHISTSLEECERRDRKGLYAKARRGEIPDFTGISSPYEEPTNAQLVIDTAEHSVSECVDLVWALMTERGYLAE